MNTNDPAKMLTTVSIESVAKQLADALHRLMVKAAPVNVYRQIGRDDGGPRPTNLDGMTDLDVIAAHEAIAAYDAACSALSARPLGNQREDKSAVVVTDVIQRANEYLQLGGLFNPELMEHDKVRDLIVDMRGALESFAKSIAERSGSVTKGE